MNNENYEEEKPKVNFYRLDKTKPFSYLGAKERPSNFFIALTFFFAASSAMMVGFGLGFGFLFNDLEGTVFPVLMIVATVVCLIAAIIYNLKISKKCNADKNVIESCTLTDGVVKWVNTRRIGNGSNTYDETEIAYSFTDDKMQERISSVKTTSNEGTQFFAGQNIMVAFTQTESFIMNRFTLIEEDNKLFKESEEARSEDDFDGLSNELVDYIDTTKPLKPLEYNYLYIVLAGCLGFILALYALIDGILIIPAFIGEKVLTVVVIACIMGALIPAVFIAIISCLIYKYLKRQKRVKKILESNPYFVWGKVFFSEKTYRNTARKTVLYCYIDKWGEKHTEELKVALSNSFVHPHDAIIAYTADGRSLVLGTYTVIQDDDDLAYYDTDEDGV